MHCSRQDQRVHYKRTHRTHRVSTRWRHHTVAHSPGAVWTVHCVSRWRWWRSPPCVYDKCRRPYIVHSHGVQSGSHTDQYDVPAHLAVDNDEFVFVVDWGNRRVTLLSPTLHYVRQVVSSNQLKWRPCHAYLHTHKRYLYVADNEWQYDKNTAGCAVVFTV